MIQHSRALKIFCFWVNWNQKFYKTGGQKSGQNRWDFFKKPKTRGMCPRVAHEQFYFAHELPTSKFFCKWGFRKKQVGVATPRPQSHRGKYSSMISRQYELFTTIRGDIFFKFQLECIPWYGPMNEETLIELKNKW